MACVKMKIHWGKKKARLEGREAGFELQQFLPSEAQGPQRQEPKGHSSKLSKITGFLRVLHRNKGPKKVTHPPETSKGFSELVQDGRFLEAYLSIPTLVKQGQDCKSLYQVVAQSMWQVVQQALEGTEYSPELELKIQAVLGTIEWTQEKHQSWEDGDFQDGDLQDGDLQDGDLQDGDLQDGGVAAWGNQLEKLLRSDVEARVPAPGPGDQVDLYLEKLEEAVTQGLGSLRASLLGPQLWKVYRTHFQEVLLSRLWELTHSFGTNWESCHMLYSWAKITLFEEPGKTLVSAPPTSQEPTVRQLLDPVTFVPWMSRMQKKLVGLIQESLEKQLENVLICDWKTWAQGSCPTFIEIFQLLEQKINAVQPIGLPITSQVQSMVLETFSKFLKRYEAEAAHFLHQNATAGPLPEVHVLANCGILRETWQLLGWAHILPAHLDAVVQDIIHVIESHSQDHFLFKGRALCKVPSPSAPALCGVFSVPREPRQEEPACVSLDFCPAQQSLCWGGTRQGPSGGLGWRGSWSGLARFLVRPSAFLRPEFFGAAGRASWDEGGWERLDLASPVLAPSPLRAPPFIPSSFLHL